MTTATTLSVVDYTSDAGFRVWGSEFHAQLVAVGLTLTSDTGQINWTTVTRPAVNTVAGYEIWRFNDTLQATTPIFIKLEFATGTAVGSIDMWITVGNGSNGSGTLTGLTSTRVRATGNQNTPYAGITPLSSVTTYTSRFVYSATLGFFGFVWKLGANWQSYSPIASAFVFRSTDSTGAPTPTSVNLLASSGAAIAGVGTMQCLNYGTALVYPQAGDGTKFTSHVFAATTTNDGTNIRIDPVFYATPTLGIAIGLGGALLSEISVGTSVSATLVGSTPHTYIQIGCPWYSPQSAVGFFGADAASQGATMNYTVLGAVMLWE